MAGARCGARPKPPKPAREPPHGLANLALGPLQKLHLTASAPRAKHGGDPERGLCLGPGLP
eukprot:4827181-Lingulodinium_polyedra.AAC.1